MMWEEINLLYELKSPVHIGYLPSKSSVISPTRYYIPSKNFWGAYTKIFTEKLFSNPTPRNYYEIGEWFKKNVRFTYFYLYDEDLAENPLLSPGYSDNGLKYGDLSLSEYQNRFIGSFISTSIDDTGTAKDESLHEIEFIRPKHQSKSGIKNTWIFGKMFIRKNAQKEMGSSKYLIGINKKGILINNENPFKVVFIGGELNYGFGKIEKVDITPEIEYDKLGFKFNLHADEEVHIDSIGIPNKKPILAHLSYSEKYCFSGDIELISGRGYRIDEKETHRYPGASITSPKPYFTPGTIVHNLQKIKLNYTGSWVSF